MDRELAEKRLREWDPLIGLAASVLWPAAMPALAAFQWTRNPAGPVISMLAWPLWVAGAVFVTLLRRRWWKAALPTSRNPLHRLQLDETPPPPLRPTPDNLALWRDTPAARLARTIERHLPPRSARRLGRASVIVNLGWLVAYLVVAGWHAWSGTGDSFAPNVAFAFLMGLTLPMMILSLLHWAAISAPRLNTLPAWSPS